MQTPRRQAWPSPQSASTAQVELALGQPLPAARAATAAAAKKLLQAVERLEGIASSIRRVITDSVPSRAPTTVGQAVIGARRA